MKRIVWGVASIAALALAVVIVVICTLPESTPEGIPESPAESAPESPVEAAATMDEIQFDKRAIEIKMKSKMMLGEDASLDSVVQELAEEQIILDRLKGTPQEITKEQCDNMRKSEEESYDKNKEENEAFIKKYNLSKEDCIEIMFRLTIGTVAKGRYITLMYDDVLSEYQQQYGEDQPVDTEKMLPLFEQQIDQMVSDLPPVTYNQKEMDKLVSSLETWKQGVDASVTMPEMQLTYG